MPEQKISKKKARRILREAALLTKKATVENFLSNMAEIFVSDKQKDDFRKMHGVK